MATRVYVSRDAAAQALGADETVLALQAAAKARGVELVITRVGSRGMVWLEPLVEVEHQGQRIAYGPVTADQVPALVDAGLFDARPHALRHGRVEDIPYFAKQERLTFARVGITDPVSVDDYIAHGGYVGLARALGMTGAAVVPYFAKREADHSYTLTILPALENFPTANAAEDALRINRLIEEYVRLAPEQYFWIHKRFKRRGPGYPEVY